MKTIKELLTLLILSVFFASCEEKDFDIPVVNPPVYTGPEATMTIAEFKAWAATKLGNNDMFASTSITAEDKIILKGTIVANDISGNLYKQLQIQDETGGIAIGINQTNLYRLYGLGGTMYVDCSGLDVGYYGGYLQLGTIYYNDRQKSNQIGQMEQGLSLAKLSLDGFPDPTRVNSDTIAIEDIDQTYVGKLITLTNVHFPTGGTAVFAPKSQIGASTTISVDLISVDNPSKSITVRNSTESNFAAKLLPAGIGTVSGILSIFQSSGSGTPTFQLTFRDSLDCSYLNFINEGNGTKEFPWSIPYVLNNQNQDPELVGWTEGYIVGSVAAGVASVTQNSDILFASPFANNATIVIAASADERDWKNCVVVNLPEGSTLQEVVGLLSDPTHLGKKIKVKGGFKNNLGTAGVVVATGASDEFEYKGRFKETFEGGAANKTGYTLATFIGVAAKWNAFSVVANNDSNDKKNGSRSVRMRDPRPDYLTPHYIEMAEDKQNGAGKITISHAMYGSHTGGGWKLMVSNNGGASWDAFTAEVTDVPASLTAISFDVNVPGNIRVRIEKTDKPTLKTSSSVNIDDIEISDYVPNN